jgi:hypothetical protein
LQPCGRLRHRHREPSSAAGAPAASCTPWRRR